MAALEQAYRNAVMTGKFPAGVLHLSVPYGAVDVNVHPAKTEVRFSDEKRIFDAVYYAVKNTLFSAGGKGEPPASRLAAPVFTEEKPTQATIRQFWQTTAPKASAAPATDVWKRPAASSSDEGEADGRTAGIPAPAAEDGVMLADSGIRLYSPGGRPVNLDITVDEPVAVPEASAENPPVASFAQDTGRHRPMAAEPDAPLTDAPPAAGNMDVNRPALRVIGEVFSTYILIEQGEELVLLDKHAAHERLIYDNLCRSETPKQQLLLTPVPVTLPREEYDAILQNLELLEKSGYAAEEFGGSILVRAVPAYLEGEDVAALISEAADGFLCHKRDAVGAKMTWLYESVACRAAIKAGDRLSLPEMTALAERILYGGDVLTCPHGRPVVLRMGKKELEKKFGRIQ